MKHAILLSAFCGLTFCIFSCSKNTDENDISKALAAKVTKIPDAPQCPGGYHWSFTLGFCIPNCTPPATNDPRTGQCVLPPPPFPYTGQQLISGIFFFQGTVASKIPYFASFMNEIAKFSPAQVDSMNAFITQITAQVNSLSPTFASRFQSSIKANNPDSIMANMDLGAGLILSAVALTNYNAAATAGGNAFNSMNINNYNFNTVGGIDTFLRDYGNLVTNSNNVTIPVEGSCLWFFGVVAVAIWDAVAVVNYAVLVNVAAIAVVWAAVYSKVLMWPRQQHFASPRLDLERETLVSQIQQYISTGGGGGGAAARPQFKQ